MQTQEEVKLPDDVKDYVEVDGVKHKISDLINPTRKFSLEATGKDYFLREVDILDEQWLEDEGLKDVVAMCRAETVNVLGLARVAFHQLKFEDQKDFCGKTRKEYTEAGEEKETLMSGPHALITMITTEEIESLVTALMYLVIQSRPEKGAALTEGADLGKKARP